MRPEFQLLFLHVLYFEQHLTFRKLQNTTVIFHLSPVRDTYLISRFQPQYIPDMVHIPAGDMNFMISDLILIHKKPIHIRSYRLRAVTDTHSP